jgi:pimeloyl-ACP methyl ester carboxylesterase
LSTKTSVRDLTELSELLDVRDWNLYGVSYGSALAAEFAQARPDLVRSAVLDSFDPPSMSRVLRTPQIVQRTLANLIRTGAVGTASDELSGERWLRLKQLLTSFGTSPRSVRMPGESFSLRVDDHRLVSGLLALSYYGPLAPRWEEVMRLGEPESELLLELASASVQQELDPEFSRIVFYTTSCNDDPPVSVADYRRELERHPEVARWAGVASERELCQPWGAGDPGPRTLVAPDVPTLFLSSLHDPVTLPEWTTEAARHFRSSYIYRSETAGHGVLWWDPAAAEVARRFLDDPRRSPSS